MLCKQNSPAVFSASLCRFLLEYSPRSMQKLMLALISVLSDDGITLGKLHCCMKILFTFSSNLRLSSNFAVTFVITSYYGLVDFFYILQRERQLTNALVILEREKKRGAPCMRYYGKSSVRCFKHIHAIVPKLTLIVTKG